MATNTEARKAYDRARYVAHRDDVLASQKAYNLAHKVERQAYSETYKAAHKAEIKAYYLEHRDIMLARANRWRADNKESLKIYDARRGAALRGADSHIWNFQMAALQSDTCQACGSHEPLQFDHIIPITQGGTSDVWNLQMLCKSCNTSKGTGTTDYRHTLEKVAA